VRTLVRIIETNLSIGNENEIIDHQSRVIEVDSWDKFVNEIKDSKSIDRQGTLWGLTLPRQCRIENLKYDDFHLSCDVYTDKKQKKLAYLIGK
jgi:hypothetical protein